MTDYLISQSQDGDGPKASYSFGFSFQVNGLQKSQNIDVLTGEAKDEIDAFELAKQRAADAKQAWMDTINAVDHRGSVNLPPPTKKDKITP